MQKDEEDGKEGRNCCGWCKGLGKNGMRGKGMEWNGMRKCYLQEFGRMGPHRLGWKEWDDDGTTLTQFPLPGPSFLPVLLSGETVE